MCMKNLDKKINITLIVAILSAIGFVSGIVAIIFGAIHSVALLVVGIVLVVFGFYGSPMLFVSYGSLKQTKRVVFAVENEKIYSVSDISKQLQMPESVVKNKIIEAINKTYLQGYLFDGEKFEANQNKSKLSKLNRCENCGGALRKDKNGTYCPYCNTHYTE